MTTFWLMIWIRQRHLTNTSSYRHLSWQLRSWATWKCWTVSQWDWTWQYLYITIDDVADQIKGLDFSKSYGPHGIPHLLLKEDGNTSVYHSVLHIFYNVSLQQCIVHVPHSFKKASVIPNHKTEPRSYIPNYRAIALLNIMANILESIISITSLAKPLYSHYSNWIFRKGNLPSPSYSKYTTNFVLL